MFIYNITTLCISFLKLGPSSSVVGVGAPLELSHYENLIDLVAENIAKIRVSASCSVWVPSLCIVCSVV